MLVQFIKYNDRAKKPRALTKNCYIYEMFIAKVYFFEDDARFIFETYIGVKVPEGYIASVVPSPSFSFLNLSKPSTVQLIEPGNTDPVHLEFVQISDICDNMPGVGEVVAWIILSPAIPFQVEMDDSEPSESELVDYDPLNLN